MKQTTFQPPEIRDANDNIIQAGTYGKASPLANSDNTGVLDYINNNLMYLYNNTMGGTGGEINTETITGKTGTITNFTATTVKAGTLTADALNGPLTGDVTGTADKATADAAGNNIQTTYAKKADLSSSVSTTSLTVTGATSVPTANAGNSSKAIANTEFVAKSISALVNGAPDQLNTLNELAKALGNDSNFAATITAELAKKLNSTEAESEYATKQEAANISTGLTQAETRISTAETRISTAETRISTAVPTGCVQAFAGSTTPQGWLLCDGSAVSRTDYAALYAVIGTTYGAGNGSTTFNLPNLTDRFIEGNATAGTVKSAGLPNITGGFGLRPVDGELNVTWEANNGAIKTTTKTGDRSSCVTKSSSYGPLMDVTIDASRSNPIYGKSTTVQPPALTMRYIIKY